MAEVELIGETRLIARLASLKRGMSPPGVAATRKIAVLIKEDSQKNTPVDTGSLRKSHRITRGTRSGRTTTVGVAVGGRVKNPKTGRLVDYAHFVHDGTSKQAPNPFLLKAVRKHKNKLPKEVMRELRRA